MFRSIDTRDSKPCGARLRQQGFSLLEVLVAFAILSVSMGVLLNIFSTGLRSAASSEDYQAAVEIANSLMAATGVESSLHEEQTSGVEQDKYRWQVSVSPFQLATENVDIASIPAELYLVTVSVSWDSGNPGGNERRFEISKLKLTGENNAQPTN